MIPASLGIAEGCWGCFLADEETASEAEAIPLRQPQEGWAETLRQGIERLAELLEARRRESSRVDRLEQKVQDLRRGLATLAESRPLPVPITTLAPDPFEVRRPIQVVVRPAGEGYVATFFDANISMSGDTEEEALSNLRELIVDVFEELEADEGSLGPEPSRQLAVLRGFIERTDIA
jgi:predicted RNase H-like HicB family nuclease